MVGGGWGASDPASRVEREGVAAAARGGGGVRLAVRSLAGGGGGVVCLPDNITRAQGGGVGGGCAREPPAPTSAYAHTLTHTGTYIHFTTTMRKLSTKNDLHDAVSTKIIYIVVSGCLRRYCCP